MKLGPEQSGFTSRLTRLALWPFRQKFTVGSLVHIESRTGEILLVQQRLRRGSCWGLPGGFQCPGEDQQQTAIREVREETSVASRCVELLQAELDCIRWPGVSADFGPGGVS